MKVYKYQNISANLDFTLSVPLHRIQTERDSQRWMRHSPRPPLLLQNQQTYNGDIYHLVSLLFLFRLKAIFQCQTGLSAHLAYTERVESKVSPLFAFR